MQNKIFGLLFVVLSVCTLNYAHAEDIMLLDDSVYDDFVEQEPVDTVQDVVSATSVANYDVEGSIFQQITDLEQQKVLMELEKQRAQLDLDLDRLAAEKIKLQMELDTLSGRAEQEQQVLQNEKSRLVAEAEKIEQERQALSKKMVEPESEAPKVKTVAAVEIPQGDMAAKYKLVNVMGAGNQLQATLYDLATGQSKRVTVGKNVDGFTVKSISLEDGVVFSKDGETQNLNISNR